MAIILWCADQSDKTAQKYKNAHKHIVYTLYFKRRVFHVIYSLIAYKSKYERNTGIYRVYNISIYKREKAYIEHIRVYMFFILFF